MSLCLTKYIIHYTFENVDHIIYFKVIILTVFMPFNNKGVDKSTSEFITEVNNINIVSGTFITIIAIWKVMYNLIYYSCV